MKRKDTDDGKTLSDAQKWWDETAEGLAQAQDNPLSMDAYRRSISEHPTEKGSAMNESDFAVQVYRSRWPIGRQQWRWRVRSVHNGKIVATGGEAYTNRAECEEMAHRLDRAVWLFEVTS
jgi:hypothetical protein